VPLVQWLLKPVEEGGGGANVAEKDHSGYTALWRAVENGHLLIVQWLLKPVWKGRGGASITEKDFEDLDTTIEQW
jgi:ankyrin repeat protein